MLGYPTVTPLILKVKLPLEAACGCTWFVPCLLSDCCPVLASQYIESLRHAATHTSMVNTQNIQAKDP